MTHGDGNKAGPLGRVARLVLGIGLAVITLPVYFRAGSTYVTASLALAVGLVVVSVALYVLVSPYFAGVNRWVLAVFAVLPVFCSGKVAGPCPKSAPPPCPNDQTKATGSTASAIPPPLPCFPAFHAVY